MGVKCFCVGLMAAVVWFCGLGSFCEAVEKLDRGVIAVRREACPLGAREGSVSEPAARDGSVYIGWRLLESDAEDVGFVVFRGVSLQKRPEKGGVVPMIGWKCLNESQPVTGSTNFVDESAPAETCRYALKVVGGQPAPGFEYAVKPIEFEKEKHYMRIAFQGDYRAQMVAVADLNGDGKLDYVIKQPDFNVDPYEAPGYWKKSEETYKIEAYAAGRRHGEFMWRYDMGWAIEEGIWYSPIVVYDIDGDGKAEVYTKAGEGDPRDPDGRVTTGPEYLVKIDGETGKVVKKVDWLSRDGFERYNYYCRNLLGVAYLDGKKPYLIMERGTYTIIRVAGLDENLKQVWYWEASGENKDYRGQGLHGLHAADVDGDGCDELVIGCAAIDHDGKPLWTLAKGHPDVAYVGDVDPDRPGLEVFYGIERSQETNPVCLVDAKTGEIIWGYKGPSKHVHGQGMCADIIGRIPGMECYAGEKDGSNYWLYDAKGNRLSDKSMGTLSPRPVYWDADPQRELIIGGRVRDYEGEECGRIEGSVVAIVDCLGDWREEIITSVEGELRIYTTTIPAETRRVCLMQDRKYRTDVAVQSMGYYYPPIEGGVPLPE